MVVVLHYSGAFSLTKTATGILFKFSNIDDFQAVYKKGFHKVTGARFYKKVLIFRYTKDPSLQNASKYDVSYSWTQVAIPCRPAKTFTVYVLDVPEELPEEDIRHALYKYRSIVEITRLPLNTGTVREYFPRYHRRYARHRDTTIRRIFRNFSRHRFTCVRSIVDLYRIDLLDREYFSSRFPYRFCWLSYRSERAKKRSYNDTEITDLTQSITLIPGVCLNRSWSN